MPERIEVRGFKTLEVLHHGSNSTVLKVQDLKSGEILAIKHVCEAKTESDKLFRHIKNEYRIGSDLRKNPGGHPPPPGILLVHELRTRRRLFRLTSCDMIMEYVDGQSLEEMKGLSVREITTVYYHTAKALQFVNLKGYAHADIKPANVLVTDDLEVKLIDFGLSCKLDTRLTSVRGTREFMAPEQVGLRRVDARTDVYNLGAAMYWMLTGEFVPSVLPDPGDRDAHVIMDVTEKPIPVRELNPDVPPGLANVVSKSCQRKKKHRYQTMHAVITALEAVYPNLR